MNHLNCVLMEGNVCTEPKAVLTSQKTGAELVSFRLASNRYYTSRDGQKVQEALFIGVEAWGELGRRVTDCVLKGMPVRVVGRLRMSEWTDKEGVSRDRLQIVAEHIEFRRPEKKGGCADEEVTLNIEKDESVGESCVIYEY